MSSEDARSLSFTTLFFLVGVLTAGVFFYLTPLNHLNLLDPTPRRISAREFYDAYDEDPEKYLLIDIRSIEFRAQEYPEMGISVPLNTLVGEMDALPRDRHIVILCESNLSAEAAYHVLQNNGFLDLQIIDGGRAAWKEAGLPLVAGDAEQQAIAQEIVRLKRELR